MVGFYEFTTNYFSYFALVDTEEIGKNTEEIHKTDEVKKMIKTLKLKVRTRALSKSLRVSVKADKKIIKVLRENGYKIKYKFYRKTKKNRFKAMVVKDVNNYINTKISKGKTYYYKVRLMVYDGEGNLIARTSLKQCKAVQGSANQKSA